VAKDGVAYLQAGGGIVFDSDPYDEWMETINKLGMSLTLGAMAGPLTSNRRKHAMHHIRGGEALRRAGGQRHSPRRQFDKRRAASPYRPRSRLRLCATSATDEMENHDAPRLARWAAKSRETRPGFETWVEHQQ
jgi:hypothetical protein